MRRGGKNAGNVGLVTPEQKSGKPDGSTNTRVEPQLFARQFQSIDQKGLDCNTNAHRQQDLRPEHRDSGFTPECAAWPHPQPGEANEYPCTEQDAQNYDSNPQDFFVWDCRARIFLRVSSD